MPTPAPRPPRRNRVERGTPLAGASRGRRSTRRAARRRRRSRARIGLERPGALYSSDLAPRARDGRGDRSGDRASSRSSTRAGARSTSASGSGLVSRGGARRATRGLRALARRRHRLGAGRVVRRDGRARPRSRTRRRRAAPGRIRTDRRASRTAASSARIVMHVLGMPPVARRLLATGPTATVTAIDATATDLAPALVQRRRPPAALRRATPRACRAGPAGASRPRVRHSGSCSAARRRSAAARGCAR